MLEESIDDNVIQRNVLIKGLGKEVEEED